MESYNASIPTAKLTFLGGGPSTLIFLLYASKTSRLYELISKKGIQIIEKGQNFGSGNFEKYIVNCSEPASEFIRLILNEPECLLSEYDLSNLLFERYLQQAIEKKSSSYSKLTKFEKIRLLDSCSPSLFKEILETQVFSELIDYLNYEAPCSLIGFFMKLVGNCLLRHIYILKEKHVFYPSHEILGVQLLNGGEMLISTKKTTNCGDIFGKFKTNTLVLSNGIFQKISCLKKIPLESVIPGDDFLKEEGFLKILKLLSLDLNKRVVIFGNSSLVFACGFLLLNGPLFYDKNELTKSPFLEKRVKKCMRCCEVCSKRATEKPFETEGNDVKNSKKSNYTEFNKKKKIAEEKKIQECDCSCVCFGDFKAAGFSSWKKSNVIMPFFKDQEVVLLINEKKSELGKNLKGSALKLFKEINEKIETRCLISEIKGDLSDLMDNYLPTTRMFIDCANYQMPTLQIKDISGQNIPLKTTEQGELIVDDNFRVISDRGSVKNLYGLGPGFVGKLGHLNLKTLDYMYQEACGKILKNVQDSLINVEKSTQWVWFSNEVFSKSASLKRNIDFELTDSDRFSLGSMDLLELEAVNMNSMGNKLKVEKGLFKKMAKTLESEERVEKSEKKLDIFKK